MVMTMGGVEASAAPAKAFAEDSGEEGELEGGDDKERLVYDDAPSNPATDAEQDVDPETGRPRRKKKKTSIQLPEEGKDKPKRLKAAGRDRPKVSPAFKLISDLEMLDDFFAGLDVHDKGEKGDFVKSLMADKDVKFWRKAQILRIGGSLSTVYNDYEKRARIRQLAREERQRVLVQERTKELQAAAANIRAIARQGLDPTLFPGDEATEFTDSTAARRVLEFRNRERTARKKMEEDFKEVVSKNAERLWFQPGHRKVHLRDMQAKKAAPLDRQFGKPPGWSAQLPSDFEKLLVVEFFDTEKMIQNQGERQMWENDAGVISEPDSGSDCSAESISGEIKSPWDATMRHPRYMYPRDNAVRFTEPLRPTNWVSYVEWVWGKQKERILGGVEDQGPGPGGYRTGAANPRLAHDLVPEPPLPGESDDVWKQAEELYLYVTSQDDSQAVSDGLHGLLAYRLEKMQKMQIELENRNQKRDLGRIYAAAMNLPMPPEKPMPRLTDPNARDRTLAVDSDAEDAGSVQLGDYAAATVGGDKRQGALFQGSLVSDAEELAIFRAQVYNEPFPEWVKKAREERVEQARLQKEETEQLRKDEAALAKARAQQLKFSEGELKAKATGRSPVYNRPKGLAGTAADQPRKLTKAEIHDDIFADLLDDGVGKHAGSVGKHLHGPSDFVPTAGAEEGLAGVERQGERIGEETTWMDGGRGAASRGEMTGSMAPARSGFGGGAMKSRGGAMKSRGGQQSARGGGGMASMAPVMGGGEGQGAMRSARSDRSMKSARGGGAAMSSMAPAKSHKGGAGAMSSMAPGHKGGGGAMSSMAPSRGAAMSSMAPGHHGGGAGGAMSSMAPSKASKGGAMSSMAPGHGGGGGAMSSMAPSKSHKKGGAMSSMAPGHGGGGGAAMSSMAPAKGAMSSMAPGHGHGGGGGGGAMSSMAPAKGAGAMSSMAPARGGAIRLFLRNINLILIMVMYLVVLQLVVDRHKSVSEQLFGGIKINTIMAQEDIQRAESLGREQTFLQHSHLHDSGRAVLLRRAAADVDAIEQEEAPAHIDNYNGSTEHASPSMDEIAQEALELEREEEVLDAEIARVCEQLASLVRRKRVQEVESVEEDRKKDVERSLEAISAAAGKDLAFLGEPLLIRTLPLNKGSEVGRGNSVGPTAAFAAG
eukprot:g3671.t1